MIKTLNQLRQELQIFADAHLQINEFYFGNFNQIYNEKIIRHTFLIADTQNIAPNRVRGGGSYTDITFIISACDQVFPDQSNWMDVKSDMFQVIMDCRNIFESPRWKAFSSVQGSPTVTYFEQKGSDRVNGWVMNVTLRIPDLRDLCAIPLVDYDLDSQLESLCAGVTIIEDGNYSQTVPSGGTFSYSTGGSGSVTIQVNGVEYIVELAPSTIDIPVLDSSANSVGTVNPSIDVVIADSLVQINGVNYESILAESTIDIPILDTSANLVGTVSPAIDVVIADSLVQINGVNFESILAESTIDIPVLNSDLTPIGSVVAGVKVSIEDSVVKNSDFSYGQQFSSGTTFLLPDINLTQPNGDIQSNPSVIDLSCTLIEDLTTQDLNDDLTPTQINQIQRQQPLRSNQTTSYRTGDDGDLEMGIGASFSTLSDNNIFGNTNRFTSELGNQTYTNNFVLDHLTGLMWYKVPNAVDTWNNAIDGCLAYAGGTFTDWFLPNINQHMTIISWGVGAIGLNYAPFSISTAEFYWTSTTQPSGTTNAIRLNNISSLPVAQIKTNTSKYLYCRKWIPSDFGL